MAVSVSSIQRNYLDLSDTNERNVEFIQKIECGCNTVRRLYQGDNVDVLSMLLHNTEIVQKVKLIYIDPPYNTGGAFETRDFKHAYNDNLSVEQYLNFMRVRLELMRAILSDDGSIYVHLDSNMVFDVKVLMDQIFGRHNFRNMITRKKCKSKNFTKKAYGNISDYILFYTKSSEYTWNRPYDEWSNDKILKEYPYIEEQTGRRYKKVPIHAPGVRNGASGSEWRGMSPPPGKHWQFTPDKLDDMDKNGEIYWSSNGNPRRKVFLDHSNGIAVQDIWMDFLDINNQNTHITGYPTEKNIDMVKRIINASSCPGDIVLDAFAGSGTTLCAAEELNRQWIGIDIGDEAIRTIFERFEKGTHRMGDYTKKNDTLPKDQPINKGNQLELFSNIKSQSQEPQSKKISFDFFVRS